MSHAQQTIRKIISTYGNSIIDDKKRFLALFEDYAPDCTDEKRRIDLLFNLDVIKLIKSAYDDPENRGLYIENAIQRLSAERINYKEAYETIIGLFFEESEQYDIKAVSAFEKAEMLYEKAGSRDDYSKAFEMYKLSAEHGHIKGQYMVGICYYHGIGVQADKNKAYELFRKAYERGCKEAKAELAQCYRNGHGVDANIGKAVKMLEEASEKNDSAAMFYLSLIYGVEDYGLKDDAKREKLLHRAAELGNADAQYLLGTFGYFDNRVVDKTPAFNLILKAAKRTKPPEISMYLLGLLYLNGVGTKRDVDKAKEIFTIAANLGVANATEQMGRICEEANEKDFVKWFIMAAEAGLAYSQYRVGTFYESGGIVEKNKEEAFKWYNKAAMQEFPQAQFRLGVNYVEGILTEKNDAKAIWWLTRAAENGHTDAALELANFYIKGKHKDLRQMIKWIEYAAKNGSANAAMIAVQIYLDSDGYFKELFNIEKAKVWLKKAASLGVAEAKNILKTLEGKSEITDYNKLEEELTLLAKKGDTEALVRLAICIMNNKNKLSCKRFDYAVELLEKALSLGDKDAAACLGSIFEGKKNYQKARRYYLIAKHKGNAESASFAEERLQVIGWL